MSQSHSVTMKVFVKNLLRPAHSLAFVCGICPYRKFNGSDYRRSALGTVFQLTNLGSLMSLCVYIVLLYLPQAFSKKGVCSSQKNCGFLIIQTSQIFLSLWLTIDRFIWISKTLRCLQLTNELNEAISRLSNLKQYPLAFYIAMVWTVLFLIRLPLPGTIDFMPIALLITTFLTLYYETLVLEFITVICIALDTINRKLQTWQTSRKYGINDLKKLQYLYLEAARLAELVDNGFGVNWLASFFAKSIQVVIVFTWVLKSFEAMIIPRDNNIPIDNEITLAYLIFRLAAGMIRCFHICYSLHQPTVKRLKIIGILREMITRNNDEELSAMYDSQMNEFTLQVTLRKMKFTAGGFFDLNLNHFGQIVGWWFTFLVMMVQLTE